MQCIQMYLLCVWIECFFVLDSYWVFSAASTKLFFLYENRIVTATQIKCQNHVLKGVKH